MTTQMWNKKLNILVVAPFVHQSGHFVTFPRDIACALSMLGHEVTLLHPRPFRIKLDEFGQTITHVCLRERLDASPRLWKELWPKLVGHPSTLCLAWVLWQIKSSQFDLILWTDFQQQRNVYWASLSKRIGLLRVKTAFVEHHPPEKENTKPQFYAGMRERFRIGNLNMIVMSKTLLAAWRSYTGISQIAHYVPWGVWPSPCSQQERGLARKALNLPDQFRILLVFGAQRVKVKHLDSLAKAVQCLATNKPLLLFFVGEKKGHHPFEEDLNLPSTIQVRFKTGFVNDDEMRLCFAASDAVWANYRNFPGASGVVLQAMGFGRLLLYSDYGEIGEICARHKCGIAIPTSNETHNMRLALEKLLAMTIKERDKLEKNARDHAHLFSWPSSAKTLLQNLGFSQHDHDAKQA